MVCQPRILSSKPLNSSLSNCKPCLESFFKVLPVTLKTIAAGISTVKNNIKSWKSNIINHDSKMIDVKPSFKMLLINLVKVC